MTIYRGDAFTSLDRRPDRGSTANLKLCQVEKFMGYESRLRRGQGLVVHTNLITKGIERRTERTNKKFNCPLFTHTIFINVYTVFFLRNSSFFLSSS